MVVRDQAVLGVDQDPGEAAGRGEGRGAKHGLGHGRGRESTHGVNVEYTWLLGRGAGMKDHTHVSQKPKAGEEPLRAFVRAMAVPRDMMTMVMMNGL